MDRFRDAVAVGIIAGMTACLLLSTCGVVADAPVRIRVDKPVLFAGATVTVTCVAPRHADNRAIQAGIAPFGTSDARQVDGVRAPITYQFPPFQVHCDDDAVFCRLVRTGPQEFVAQSPIEVKGCDGGAADAH